jgi:hypothetical protein
MWAHIEYFDGGIIRVFDDRASFLQEPYLYSIAFKNVEGEPNVIELVGATKAPTTEQLRAVVRELRSRGIRVRRLRIDGARPGWKEFK